MQYTPIHLHYIHYTTYIPNSVKLKKDKPQQYKYRYKSTNKIHYKAIKS